MNVEYYLFSNEDPIQKLNALAKRLPIHKKMKVAPYIRRAKALAKSSDSFRTILSADENTLDGFIGTLFVLYFEEKVDKKGFVVVSRDPSYDFLKFITKVSSQLDITDKYIHNATTKILANAKAIDSFIKAFMSIRQAQGELNKLMK